jgi:hypothetical protein
MDSHPLNRFVVVALALPAAVLIAGVGAVSDYIFPRGSWLNFLAAMLLTSLVIAGVMAAFATACEKCETCPDPVVEPVRHIHAARNWLRLRRFGASLLIRPMSRFYSHSGDCGHS